MKYIFFSDDFGALVFGREILKRNPMVELDFQVKTKVGKSLAKALCERDFWKTGMEESVQESKFGRVGIFFDRENFDAKNFFSTSNFSKSYKPKNSRAEKNLQISTFETQILKTMANENWADSVEFRRIARKFLRQAKHANVDTIFFADAILASEVARKVLQHLAGPRIRCVFVTDFLGDEFFKVNKGKGSLKITTGDDVEFTREVAEKVLRKKIGKDSLSKN